MSPLKQIILLITVLLSLFPGRSSNQGYPKWRFGAQQISAGFGQEQALGELESIGIGWGRGLFEYFEYDVLRNFGQRGSTFNFEKPDAATEAAYDAGICLIGQLTTDILSPRNVPLQGDTANFKAYLRLVVERYDGDTEFGVEPSDPLYPDCDLNNDGLITSEEKTQWAQQHRFHIWELVKEPLPPEAVHGPGQIGLTAEEVVEILQVGWEAIHEVDPDAVVLFGGIAPGPIGGLDKLANYLTEILQSGGGQYFDILGIDAFTHPVEDVLDIQRGILQSSGLEKLLWVVQIGTNDGGFGHNPYGGTLQKQAAFVVKGFVKAFAAGQKKFSGVAS